MFNAYLKSGAVYEIDICERDREEIKRSLEAHRIVDIFKKPQSDAFRALSVDSFLRFCVWIEELLGIPPTLSNKHELSLSTSSSTSSFTSSSSSYGHTTFSHISAPHSTSSVDSPSTSPRRMTRSKSPGSPQGLNSPQFSKPELQSSSTASSVSLLLVRTT